MLFKIISIIDLNVLFKPSKNYNTNIKQQNKSWIYLNTCL